MDPRRHVNPDPRRSLPAVDQLSREVGRARPDLPAWAITAAARELLEEARSGGVSSSFLRDVDWEQRTAEAAARLAAPHPRQVVNATGVLLHTNLGRAPVAPGAAVAAARVAAGYSELEFDLPSGRRGKRLGSLETKLRLLSGAEAATACNNNAAAVLLALDTLARGREVVVSRGELVEIGGSFRVPEIVERAGVRLVEVGTTNRTHPRDYEGAIGPETALLLKVHRSNFEQRGFVAEVGLGELVELGRAHGLPVVEDLGSGTLLDLSDRGLPAEAFAGAGIRSGADLVCFSGDKLLGGPQAGLVLGRRDPVAAMSANPLARALRLDKMSLAALDWTLGSLLAGRGEQEIPVLRRLLEPLESLEVRARALAERLEKAAESLPTDLAIGVEADRSPVGGGSLPGFALDTRVVAIRSASGRAGGVEELAARLRCAPTPVVARVRDDALLLDLRSLSDDDTRPIEEAIRSGLR
jgi:L-seryl-tRNA(Ser) seleniumtransferase